MDIADVEDQLLDRMDNVDDEKQPLALYDDHLTTLLLDGLFLHFRTRKILQRMPPPLPDAAFCARISDIIRISAGDSSEACKKLSSLLNDRSSSNATSQFFRALDPESKAIFMRYKKTYPLSLMRLSGLRDAGCQKYGRGTSKALNDSVKFNSLAYLFPSSHAASYIGLYHPDAGVEITKTTRYRTPGETDSRLVSTRNWRCGDMIKQCEGRLATVSSKSVIDGEHFSVMRSRKGECYVLGPIRFVNHDCDPNCRFINCKKSLLGLRVLRDVKPGEEITVLYAADYFAPNQCLCETCERTQRGGFTPKDTIAALVGDYEMPTLSRLRKTESRVQRLVEAQDAVAGLNFLSPAADAPPLCPTCGVEQQATESDPISHAKRRSPRKGGIECCRCSRHFRIYGLDWPLRVSDSGESKAAKPASPKKARGRPSRSSGSASRRARVPSLNNASSSTFAGNVNIILDVHGKKIAALIVRGDRIRWAETSQPSTACPADPPVGPEASNEPPRQDCPTPSFQEVVTTESGPTTPGRLPSWLALILDSSSPLSQCSDDSESSGEGSAAGDTDASALGSHAVSMDCLDDDAAVTSPTSKSFSALPARSLFQEVDTELASPITSSEGPHTEDFSAPCAELQMPHPVQSLGLERFTEQSEDSPQTVTPETPNTPESSAGSVSPRLSASPTPPADPIASKSALSSPQASKVYWDEPLNPLASVASPLLDRENSRKSEISGGEPPRSDDDAVGDVTGSGTRDVLLRARSDSPTPPQTLLRWEPKGSPLDLNAVRWPFATAWEPSDEPDLETEQALGTVGSQLTVEAWQCKLERQTSEGMRTSSPAKKMQLAPEGMQIGAQTTKNSLGEVEWPNQFERQPQRSSIPAQPSENLVGQEAQPRDQLPREPALLQESADPSINSPGNVESQYQLEQDLETSQLPAQAKQTFLSEAGSLNMLEREPERESALQQDVEMEQARQPQLNLNEVDHKHEPEKERRTSSRKTTPRAAAKRRNAGGDRLTPASNVGEGESERGQESNRKRSREIDSEAERELGKTTKGFRNVSRAPTLARKAAEDRRRLRSDQEGDEDLGGQKMELERQLNVKELRQLLAAKGKHHASTIDNGTACGSAPATRSPSVVRGSRPAGPRWQSEPPGPRWGTEDREKLIARPDFKYRRPNGGKRISTSYPKGLTQASVVGTEAFEESSGRWNLRETKDRKGRKHSRDRKNCEEIEDCNDRKNRKGRLESKGIKGRKDIEDRKGRKDIKTRKSNKDMVDQKDCNRKDLEQKERKEQKKGESPRTSKGSKRQKSLGGSKDEKDGDNSSSGGDRNGMEAFHGLEGCARMEIEWTEERDQIEGQRGRGHKREASRVEEIAKDERPSKKKRGESPRRRVMSPSPSPRAGAASSSHSVDHGSRSRSSSVCPLSRTRPRSASLLGAE
ncbi:hypothetical protein BDK51DRAFT_34139 [Blyttiomyces helicus]|uniref:SET domain-containing protein n=1 Tax=Blyttiomyces helicus TaxID=388810 RepID=A0A4P9WNF4_9FUNG|nr:hypothetical protein BDK51DRAFT_34139 [Blyttiomyces helicus]|eukprot:RKO93613.1 hypothetical protein BDK51DRAFT_34139 [Blyttiomyces helicus]